MLSSFLFNFIFLYMIFCTNSLVMLLMIIMMSYLLGYYMSFNHSPWVMIIILLVYSGGVMIMFLYVNSSLNFKPFEKKYIYVFFLISLLNSKFFIGKMKFDIISLNMNMNFMKEIYSFFFMALIAIFIFLINKMLTNTKGVINSAL